MIQYLIFDLDGTLVDSYEAITESLNHALERLGLPPRRPEVVRGMVGLGLEVLIGQAAGEDKITEGVRLFRRHYSRICEEKTRLLPEVRSTLQSLQRRGFRMAVATNKPTRFTKRILSTLAIRNHFDCLMGPEEVAHLKPHPEMVFRILRHFGCSRRQAVFVGDMVVDVETSKSAGVRVLVLPTGSQKRHTLEKAGPDGIVDRFSELPAVLRGMNGSSGIISRGQLKKELRFPDPAADKKTERDLV